MKKDYKIVTTIKGVEDLLADFKSKKAGPVISWDLETTSLYEPLALVTDIGLSHTVGTGWNIALRYYDQEKDELVPFFTESEEQWIVREVENILFEKPTTGWNLIYDITVWKWRYGTDLTETMAADAMLQKHTVDEFRPHGLKPVATKYKSEIGISEEELANQEQLEMKESVLANGGRWSKDQKDIYKADYKIRGRYACADVDLSLRLFYYFDQRLTDEGLEDFFYDREVMPLYKKATIPMKLGGINVDVDYFQRLKRNLENDIMNLEADIFDTIEPWVQPFVRELLNDKHPVSKRGKFAERLLLKTSLDVPLTPSGKPSLAKTKLQKLSAAYPDHPVLEWFLWEPTPITEEVEEPVLEEDGTISGYKVITKIVDYDVTGEPQLDPKLVQDIQREIFVEKNPDCPKVFNLNSNDHLAWLLFFHLGLEPIDVSRKTGKPKVDKDSLDKYKDDHPFIATLLQLFKLEKLYGTYVCPILANQFEGVMYPSFLQHGTTSGRYSSGGAGINFQNIPSNDTSIKKGFVAPEGYSFIAADYASLEARIFSYVSGDPGLIGVYNKGEDLYSRIAIDVFGLDGYSAHPDDDNFLKKVNPAERNKAKVFTLAVPYGSGPYAVAKSLKFESDDFKEIMSFGRSIINKYLDAYPGLKEFMERNKWQAINEGFVETGFGRVRHLDEANYLYYGAGANGTGYGKLLFNKKAMKELLGKDLGESTFNKFKNFINNSRNFPIQGTAAHLINAATMQIKDEFDRLGLDGRLLLNVHDELVYLIRDDQIDTAFDIIKEGMENNWVAQELNKSLPIIAEPIVGKNLAAVK